MHFNITGPWAENLLATLQVVPFNSPGCGVDDQPTNRLHVSMSSSSLAYIIYTSGSTGRPKGMHLHACPCSGLHKACPPPLLCIHA